MPNKLKSKSRKNNKKPKIKTRKVKYSKNYKIKSKRRRIRAKKSQKGGTEGVNRTGSVNGPVFPLGNFYTPPGSPGESKQGFFTQKYKFITGTIRK